MRDHRFEGIAAQDGTGSMTEQGLALSASFQSPVQPVRSQLRRDQHRLSQFPALRKSLFAATAMVLGFVCIVFPNSLRPMSIIVLVAAASVALLCTKRFAINFRWLLWLSASAITMFFVAVGWSKKPSEALWQVPFVYVLSPALWLMFCPRLLENFSIHTVVRAILFFGMLGALSVFGFYYLFLTMGADAVRWVIKLPNVDFGDGRAGATMYVFGSLMFVAGGFFSAPQVVARNWMKFGMVVVLVAAALLSGRTALMLSILIGCLVFAVAFQRNNDYRLRIKPMLSIVAIFAVAMVIIVLTAERFGFDMARILGSMLAKLGSGGGEERSAQFHALLKGIQDHWFLGAGHGIGVPLVRDDEYPWRYELLWLATVHRIGVAGALVYLLPVAIIVRRYAAMLISRSNSSFSDFMFGGFLAAFLGSGTNPYYESFEFQWMLLLPFVYFTMSSPRRNARQEPDVVPHIPQPGMRRRQVLQRTT